LKEKGLSSERDDYLLDAIRELARGYSRWDRFHYEEVKQKLRQGEEDLRTYKNLAQPRGQMNLSEERIEENIGFLSELQNETFGFDFEKRIGKSLAVDMFWNATRRAEEGKYDDGIVRLYRTVEMFGQVEIYEELGCHTDAVPVELVPEALRDELRKKSDGEEKVELGLKDNFLVLNALGNEIGENFLARDTDFKKIMRTRNTSFLTHNFKAIEESQFDSQRETVEDIFEVDSKVEFPELKIT
ncbi:MAG: TIGR02710 family CRISPR-associated CARF protein, partial [Candidatus Bipolaricaulota bacterium]